MKWVAWCTMCDTDLTDGGWANGQFVEAQADLHKKEKGDNHKVIVGFFYERKEEEKSEGGGI